MLVLALHVIKNLEILNYRHAFFARAALQPRSVSCCFSSLIILTVPDGRVFLSFRASTHKNLLFATQTKTIHAESEDEDASSACPAANRTQHRMLRSTLQIECPWPPCSRWQNCGKWQFAVDCGRGSLPKWNLLDGRG